MKVNGIFYGVHGSQQVIILPGGIVVGRVATPIGDLPIPPWGTEQSRGYGGSPNVNINLISISAGGFPSWVDPLGLASSVSYNSSSGAYDLFDADGSYIGTSGLVRNNGLPENSIFVVGGLLPAWYALGYDSAAAYIAAKQQQAVFEMYINNGGGPNYSGAAPGFWPTSDEGATHFTTPHVMEDGIIRLVNPPAPVTPTRRGGGM